jgi:hypothetical protein
MRCEPWTGHLVGLGGAVKLYARDSQDQWMLRALLYSTDALAKPTGQTGSTDYHSLQISHNVGGGAEFFYLVFFFIG